MTTVAAGITGGTFDGIIVIAETFGTATINGFVDSSDVPAIRLYGQAADVRSVGPGPSEPWPSARTRSVQLPWPLPGDAMSSATEVTALETELASIQASRTTIMASGAGPGISQSGQHGSESVDVVTYLRYLAEREAWILEKLQELQPFCVIQTKRVAASRRSEGATRELDDYRSRRVGLRGQPRGRAAVFSGRRAAGRDIRREAVGRRQKRAGPGRRAVHRPRD